MHLQSRLNDVVRVAGANLTLTIVGNHSAASSMFTCVRRIKKGEQASTTDRRALCLPPFGKTRSTTAVLPARKLKLADAVRKHIPSQHARFISRVLAARDPTA